MENDDDICRACMGPAGTTTAVLLTNSIADLYGQIIQSHVSLKDGLPQQLCSKCSKIMLKLANFRDMGVSSEATLKYLYISSQVLGTKIQHLNEIKTELDLPAEQNGSTVESDEIEDERMMESKFVDKCDVVGDKDTLDSEEAFELKHDAVDEHSFLYEIKECVPTMKTLRKKNIPANPEDNENFPCGLCMKIYNNWESLTDHLDSHKIDKTCGLCEATFWDWPQLVTHRTEHIDNKHEHLCYICNKKYRSAPYLQAHLSVHHFGEEGALCNICGKICKSGIKLKKHQNRHNVPESKLNVESKLKCGFCLKKYKTKTLLESHLLKHSDEKNNVCEICGAAYKQKAALKNHMDKTHKNPNFECGICDEMPLTNNELKVHIESHKMDKACKICNKSFTDWPELLLHRYEHVSHSGRTYECHICSKKLRTLGTLNTHFRAVHNTGIECTLCSKVFFNSRKLQKHMYLHTNIKKYKCENCNKRFTTHGNLLVHSAIHSSEKNYACDFCDFRCKISNGLRLHIKRKHMLGRFPCKYCNKVFTNDPALRDHQKNHNGTSMCAHCGIHVTNKEFKRHVRRHTNPCRYKCDLCPKEFLTKQNMIYHINRHNGFKSNKCEFCSATFYAKSVLIKHRRIHTGEKPYVCKICNKGFTGGNNLKVHMKVHGLLLVVKRDTTSLKASIAD